MSETAERTEFTDDEAAARLASGWATRFIVHYLAGCAPAEARRLAEIDQPGGTAAHDRLFLPAALTDLARAAAEGDVERVRAFLPVLKKAFTQALALLPAQE
jgi:hypothetical protein